MSPISQGGDGSQVSSGGFYPDSDEPAWPSLPIPAAFPQHSVPSSQPAVGRGKAEDQGPHSCPLAVVPCARSARPAGAALPLQSAGSSAPARLPGEAHLISHPLPFHAPIEHELRAVKMVKYLLWDGTFHCVCVCVCRADNKR